MIGFLLSIALTLFAYEAVKVHVLSFKPLLFVILLLAVVQILVQLLLFMHVTESHGPRYHILAFSLALFFVFVFVAASIWIMSFNTPIS